LVKPLKAKNVDHYDASVKKRTWTLTDVRKASKDGTEPFFNRRVNGQLPGKGQSKED